MNISKLSADQRRKVYEVAIIIGALLVAHGIVSGDDVANIVQIIGIGLGTIVAPALARANTPKSPADD